MGLSLDFVIVDETSTIPEEDLTRMSEALMHQLNEHVSQFYGGSYAVRWAKAGHVPDLYPGEVVCSIVDTLPDVPGAVAYHDITGNDAPIVFCAKSLCRSTLTGSNSIAVALSHELCETVGDLSCNLWADDGTGVEWARELCDATQESTYEIDDVSVSNFLLPSFFTPRASTPFSFIGTVGTDPITAPFQTAPGGYQIRRVTGNSQQVTGKFKHEKKARHWGSRAYKRGMRF